MGAAPHTLLPCVLNEWCLLNPSLKPCCRPKKTMRKISSRNRAGRPALEVLKTPTTQNTAVNGTTGQPPKLGLH